MDDTKQQKEKKRVFVGLSGGVDSSVAAALLREAGHEVTGAFIKVWHPDFLPCQWKEERQDAMRVAATLGIPFLTLDLAKEYKGDVVDYMLREYRTGRTPNPDVMCNRHIKFGAFWKFAREQGADAIATGHYARIMRDTDGVNRLLAGRDSNKDQSYFLWTLTQDDLAHTFFPVGDYEKPHVRELAKRFGLPTATKKDSQGVCFIGKLDMKMFLSRFIEPKRGKVLNEEGVVIGTHDGAWFYTIGQRHGFTVNQQTPTETPYYVIGKNIERNTLTVSQTPATSECVTKELNLTAVNWIGGEMPQTNTPYAGRLRYRQEFVPLRIRDCSSKRATIELVGAASATPQGQSFVLYDGEECLGGGIIS